MAANMRLVENTALAALRIQRVRGEGNTVCVVPLEGRYQLDDRP